MELTIKHPIERLRISDLPVIKQASDDSVFNPAYFVDIFNRVIAIKRNAPRQWGKMNLVQMLNHLKVATGSAIDVYQLKDESNFLWHVILQFFVLRILKRLPKNAKSPEGFKIEMNNSLVFETEKREVLQILEKSWASRKDSFPHPLFGSMSRKLWGRLVYRHFDHHLRQFAS